MSNREIPLPLTLGLIAATLVVMARGCQPAKDTAAQPTAAAVQSPAEDRRDDCLTQANLKTDVALDRNTKQWPASTQSSLQAKGLREYPNTDDLVVTVADGRATWQAKPGVVVCFAAVGFPSTNNSSDFRLVLGVSESTGSFPLPKNAIAATVQGWLPTAGPGLGTNAPSKIPSDFGPLQLENCRRHGNVVGTVKRDPKTSLWGPAKIHTIIPGQPDQPATSLTTMLGRKNYAKYAVTPGVVACESEVSTQGHQPFIANVDRAAAMHAPPRDTINGYTVLLYDPLLPDGEGSLKLHRRR